MIDIACPQCGAVYHSDEAHVGKHVKCTRCGGVVHITDPNSARILSVEAEPVRGKTGFATTPPAKTATSLRSRWPLYAGAFVILLVVSSVWKIWYTNRKDEAKPDEGPNHAIPSATEDASRQGVNFDEVVDEQASKNEQGGRASASQFHKDVPKPDPRPTHYNSLPTGTRITDDVGTNGHGKLTISNLTDSDAVVRLYETSSFATVRWFSVQAQSRCSMNGIPEGAYTLAYTSGLDWIDSQDAFRWHPSYHEFERSLKYSERTDTEGVQYHEISVTLHPVVGGNIRTRQISRDDFIKGHRHMPLQKSQSGPAF